ncbi:plant UBX domain-containing protein 8-like isoform X2 [Neltuma alba]|uniref:plant UBX domain-containing protein 8-like isoform X2 n=1 Tax=Neltuma alba TaxID=207710 RepID=UPI0010A398E3|nr:plant UBX domain-containing protein 8-like isoform X2 [Prosopis alba]
MARPDQEDVETFMSITGLSEAIAVRKLVEHGDINEALYAHYNEGDRNLAARSRQRSLSHLSPAGNHNPSSFLDPTVRGNAYDAPSDPTKQSRSVTQPGEVRDTPIDVRDGNQYSPQAGHSPIIGTVPPAHYSHQDEQRNTILSDISLRGSAIPTVLSYENQSDCSDDTEEQMIRAAIEASKKEYEELSESGILEDPELAHAISLSIESAEQEQAQRLQGNIKEPIVGPPKSSEVEPVKIAGSNGRLQAGSSFSQDEAEDAEEWPLIRNRSRPVSLGPTDLVESADAIIETSTLSSSGNQDSSNSPQHKRNANHVEEELERQLAAKEAALPPEPSLDDENAVTLLVKMPDGSRRERQFLRSDNLQVRHHPRRAFSDEEGALTLNEAGLTSKQEALFLELI